MAMCYYNHGSQIALQEADSKNDPLFFSSSSTASDRRMTFCPKTSLGPLASFIEQWENAQVEGHSHLMSLSVFVDSLRCCDAVSEQCYVLGLIYAATLRSKWLAQDCRLCGHCVFLGCLVLACKFLQDVPYNNGYWARAAGIDLHLVNTTEVLILQGIQCQLFVSPELFDHWADAVKCEEWQLQRKYTFCERPLFRNSDGISSCCMNFSPKRCSCLSNAQDAYRTQSWRPRVAAVTTTPHCPCAPPVFYEADFTFGPPSYNCLPGQLNSNASCEIYDIHSPAHIFRAVQRQPKPERVHPYRRDHSFGGIGVERSSEWYHTPAWAASVDRQFACTTLTSSRMPYFTAPPNTATLLK